MTEQKPFKAYLLINTADSVSNLWVNEWTRAACIKGRLHTLNQMVNQMLNHLVSCWRVAGNPNTRLKLT